MKPEDIYELYGFYDPRWCITVKGGMKAICVHPAPVSFDAVEVPYDERVVTLHAMNKDGKHIGVIGRCDVCGKVYHLAE